MGKMGERVWNVGEVERVVRRDRGIQTKSSDEVKVESGFKAILDREMDKYK